MLVAKLLTDQISLIRGDDEDFREDPNIPEEFYTWASKKNVKNFIKLINEKGIFNAHEISRKANLMHVLNIISAIIGGISNRNERAIEHLDDFALEFNQKDEIVDSLEKAATFILKIGLRQRSYWLNKANFFSLIIVIIDIQNNGIDLDPKNIKAALEHFEENLPEDYKFAATEAVNSTKARHLRNKYLNQLLLGA